MALAAPVLLPLSARAQSPDRTARIVVGFPRGGSIDLVAHL
jgi:tripartite-type tricarboxylate transporter receptor subunit TctC